MGVAFGRRRRDELRTETSRSLVWLDVVVVVVVANVVRLSTTTTLPIAITTSLQNIHDQYERRRRRRRGTNRGTSAPASARRFSCVAPQISPRQVPRFKRINKHPDFRSRSQNSTIINFDSERSVQQKEKSSQLFSRLFQPFRSVSLYFSSLSLSVSRKV